MTFEPPTKRQGTRGIVAALVPILAGLLMLASPGDVPALEGKLPKPLGNTSRTVLLCDRKGGDQPIDRVERAFEKGRVMPISSYDDDPFVQDSIVECMDGSGFARGLNGLPILFNNRTLIQDERIIYRQDRGGDEEQRGQFIPFATNPWPCAPLPSAPEFCLPTANGDGSFRFHTEPRFPLLERERDADGNLLLRNGLQVWTPNDLHRGMTTAFETANKVKDAAEDWSGRHLAWGVEEILEINAHAFIDFNAFYSPSARKVFFGVVPYRLPGTTDIKIFEMATSAEMAAHETGHAVHHTLKPNVDPSDLGFRTWGESFADQFAMWTGLRDPGRVRSLLQQTGGDLASSNALTRIGEVFAALVGEGTGLRDAFHDKKVSDTSAEFHDRSEVLTGALYRLLVSIYDELQRQSGVRALEEAGAILGTFLTAATDYTPENTLSLEDVGKAYLKVDKEFFGGRYRQRLVDELTRREIFGANSVLEWLTHEAAVPLLRLPHGHGVREVESLVQANLDRLGIGGDFGLVVQSVIRDDRRQQTVVRVQLTLGRDPGAPLLDNHGVLVFRANGRLADYHGPLPENPGSHALAMALIDHGRRMGLHGHGAPLSIVCNRNGALTVEARVLRGTGLNVWLEAFTLANPRGERREVVSGSWATGAKADLLQRAGTVLTGRELEQ